MKNSEEIVPKGIVAILVSNDGRPIVNAADFHRGSPGGFTQQEAQRMRVRDKLAHAVICELSSPLLHDAIDNYRAKQILEKMCENGCRVFTVPIGYDDEQDGEQ